MANRCGSCDYLNDHDTKWGGEKAWCNYKGYYVKTSDVGCNNYTYHGHCYGRYLVTAICEILNLDEKSKNSLFSFFDKVMFDKTPEIENMYDMILSYDIVGPLIADKLYTDKFKECIADSMLFNYIFPAKEDVICGNYEDAVNRYADMTNCLFDFYFKEKDVYSRKRS